MNKNNKNTRIQNRFEFWSVADCSCEYCQFYQSKKQKCMLHACCCADIREEASRRECIGMGNP